MEHNFTHSSWIQSVSYDDETQFMKVTTQKDTFELAGVDLKTYQEFKSAPSKGSYFNKYCRVISSIT